MKKLSELSQSDSKLLFSKPLSKQTAEWFAKQLKKYGVKAESTINNVRVHLFDLANAIEAKEKILQKYRIVMHSEQKLREIISRYVVQELSALSRAEDLALDVHAGQTRKGSGLPYYVHPYRVYLRSKKLGLSKEHQLLAVLHDTYEDAKKPVDVLNKIRSEFGPQLASKVELLSHDKSIDYNDYLLSLSKKDSIAFDIKLLDMENNLIDNPSEKQKLKYKNALLFILNRGAKINPKLQDSLFTKSDITEKDLQ